MAKAKSLVESAESFRVPTDGAEQHRIIERSEKLLDNQAVVARAQDVLREHNIRGNDPHFNLALRAACVAVA